MNNHQRQIKAEAEAVTDQRKRSGRTSLYAILLCFVIFSLVGMLRTNGMDTASPPVGDWTLILVSEQNLLSQSFTVDLKALPGGQVDVRIASLLQQMMARAKEDGVVLNISAGYQSVKEQAALYETAVQSYISRGYGAAEAARRAARYVPSPGASEHHTGLAVDFVTGTDTVSGMSFQDTAAYDWLKAHAAAYGFIERYPKDKEDITGVLWQPWHFRYIGEESAQFCKTSGIVLEELLTITDTK